jgi:hypothetical protein
MRQQPNHTCMLKNLLKLYCIWTWNTLWGFGLFVCFVLCGFVLFYFFPLMRQLQNNIWGTISRFGGWGTNTKIVKTETSLHLNLEVFLIFVLFIFYFFKFLYIFFLSFTYFFIFILIFILFIFYFQSSLCLSNAFSVYGWLVHSLSLFISLKFFLFVSCFVFFYLFICFSLFL